MLTPNDVLKVADFLPWLGYDEATKLAGAGGTKGTLDAAAADELLAKIDEIAEIFWETKKA